MKSAPAGAICTAHQRRSAGQDVWLAGLAPMAQKTGPLRTMPGFTWKVLPDHEGYKSPRTGTGIGDAVVHHAASAAFREAP